MGNSVVEVMLEGFRSGRGAELETGWGVKGWFGE